MADLADLSSERAVLDCLLSAPDSIPAVRAVLEPRAFYWNQHRTIYRVALALADAGQEPDVLTVQAELERQGPAKHGQSWAETLGELGGTAPLWTNAARYASRVAELGHLRRLSAAAAFLAQTPEDDSLRGELLAAIDAADGARAGARRLVAPLVDDFVAQDEAPPAALVGTHEDALLPAGGLLIEFARGGKGKTTLTLDLVLHMVSGVEWLGFPIGRPLNVLFVENEGPRAAWRAKLARKLEQWPHELHGALRIVQEPWGQMTLADRLLADELRELIVAEAIDVVVGDPLDTFGLEGVGSPEDTRKFLQLLTRLGLGNDVAFIFLAHPRKELTTDELDEISGAWGGRPDTMLRLAKLDGSRARLSFPKFRWSRLSDHPALILAFEPSDESFTVLASEVPAVPVEERNVLAEVVDLLADGVWRTAREICAPRAREGIGAKRALVEAVLDDHPELFVSAPGHLVGRSPKARAICWRLAGPDAGATGASEGL